MTCECHAAGAETRLPDCGALVRELDAPRDRSRALDMFLLVEGDGLRRPGALSPDARADAALGSALKDVARRHGGGTYRVSDAIYAILVETPEAAPPAAVAVAVEAAVAETAPWLGRRIVHGRTDVPGTGGEGTQLAAAAFEALGRRLAREPQSPGRQARDVLLQLLSERQSSGPGARRAQVASLAVATGRSLQLPSDELDDVVRAAELQDVGLAVLPDAIRFHRRRLTEAEWNVVRRHPVAGQRIVGAAPALAPVARLVRSCYERYDGTGYPDGLAGDDIPLGARIIAACVAFDAMTSERPHRPARSAEAALAELEGCAGTQFDPSVVAVVCALARQASVEGSGAKTSHFA